MDAITKEDRFPHPSTSTNLPVDGTTSPTNGLNLTSHGLSPSSLTSPVESPCRSQGLPPSNQCLSDGCDPYAQRKLEQSESPSPSPSPIPSPEANRFGTASRFLRTAFRKLTRRSIEEAKIPITIRLDKDRTNQLKELTLLTAENLYQRGICTVDLAYTRENGLTCLTFRVNAVASEYRARFAQVNLNVRLLDLGKLLDVDFQGYKADIPSGRYRRYL
jgi:hypothetical protein